MYNFALRPGFLHNKPTHSVLLHHNSSRMDTWESIPLEYKFVQDPKFFPYKQKKGETLSKTLIPCISKFWIGSILLCTPKSKDYLNIYFVNVYII